MNVDVDDGRRALPRCNSLGAFKDHVLKELMAVLVSV